jgi:hypothetical protein
MSQITARFYRNGEVVYETKVRPTYGARPLDVTVHPIFVGSTVAVDCFMLRDEFNWLYWGLLPRGLAVWNLVNGDSLGTRFAVDEYSREDDVQRFLAPWYDAWQNVQRSDVMESGDPWAFLDVVKHAMRTAGLSKAQIQAVLDKLMADPEAVRS